MRILISEGFDKNIVYHGSAVKFNAFDPKFIGSGHETEVHGYGFYFSLNEKVARYYAKELKQVSKFFYEECNIDGALFNSKENFGEVKNLVIFSEDSIVKILDIEKI